MTFKAKLRRIGNSLGVITPKEVITDYKEGDVITLSLEKVITNVFTGNKQKVITPELVITGKGIVPDKVITPKKRLVFNVKTGMNEWK